jgi:hypothetical protein
MLSIGLCGRLLDRDRRPAFGEAVALPRSRPQPLAELLAACEVGRLPPSN